MILYVDEWDDLRIFYRWVWLSYRGHSAEILELDSGWGPTSFEDLLTVDGIYYLSFKEVAEKRDLLELDESITECLIETTISQMPKALQKLFAKYYTIVKLQMLENYEIDILKQCLKNSKRFMKIRTPL